MKYTIFKRLSILPFLVRQLLPSQTARHASPKLAVLLPPSDAVVVVSDGGRESAGSAGRI